MIVDFENRDVDSPLIQPKMQPVTDELYYTYDFGDDWTVKITRIKDCQDLLDAERLSEEELKSSIEIVKTFYKPICIAQDGYNLMDDAGNMHGYTNFLKSIHRKEYNKGTILIEKERP